MANDSRRHYVPSSDHDPRTRTELSTSKYCEYPPAQPFIHDDYRRDVTKPIITYPESNRQGVMSALRNLQEKMKQIELEKQEAEHRVAGLSHAVDQSATGSSHAPVPSASLSSGTITDTMHASDVHGRLLAQEERCRALERQLDRTRVMVQQAEHDRADALRKMAKLRTDNLHSEAIERRACADKITELEREQLRLMATQTLAHNKIKDLEERLEDERRYRLLMQTKSPEPEPPPQPVTETDFTPEDDEGQPEDDTPTTKPARRRKKRSMSAARTVRPARGVVGRKYPGSSGCSRKMPGSEPPEHFHLNLAEIPFLTGKSTGQSHSVSANFQEVLSLMKSHNPKLCAGAQNHTHAGPCCSHLRALHRTASARCNRVHVDDDNGAIAPPADELVDLIIQLEDEFGQLSVEHEDLTRQIHEANDQRLQYDLERELDGLVSRMESKGEQIVKLKRLQARLPKRGGCAKKLRGRGGSGSCGRSRPTTASTRIPNGGGEVLIATTVSTRGKGTSLVKPAAGSNGGGILTCSKAQGSLHLLKDLKKIQSTLRTDDIIWDCS